MSRAFSRHTGIAINVFMSSTRFAPLLFRFDPSSSFCRGRSNFEIDLFPSRITRCFESKFYSQARESNRTTKNHVYLRANNFFQIQRSIAQWLSSSRKCPALNLYLYHFFHSFETNVVSTKLHLLYKNRSNTTRTRSVSTIQKLRSWEEKRLSTRRWKNKKTEEKWINGRRRSCPPKMEEAERSGRRLIVAWWHVNPARLLEITPYYPRHSHRVARGPVFAAGPAAIVKPRFHGRSLVLRRLSLIPLWPTVTCLHYECTRRGKREGEVEDSWWRRGGIDLNLDSNRVDWGLITIL